MFADDYLIIKIDVEEMVGGDRVAAMLQQNRPGGFPWFTILDSRGKELAASNAPDGGNIGAPIGEAEQAHFINMIKSTMQHAPADRIDLISKALAEYAQQHR